MTGLPPLLSGDIPPTHRWNPTDAAIVEAIVAHAETPDAIRVFAERCGELTDSAYWEVLGTLWVSYTGWSDLTLWKRLFSSRRRCRKLSLMRPSEYAAFKRLPAVVPAYRVHRPEEKDWIAYTLSLEKACDFARLREAGEIGRYRLRKEDCTALFLRRGEQEIIMLDPARARHDRTITIRWKE